MMTMLKTSRVPKIDLTGSFAPGPARDEVVSKIRAACEDVGFLIITGHGVPSGKIRHIEAKSREFMALPFEEKDRYTDRVGNFRGYIPSKASSIGLAIDDTSQPEPCELFSINRFDDRAAAVRAGLKPGREDFFAPNIWPERPEGFKEAYEGYYEVLERLANHLMSLMALALGLDENWFADKITDHITSLTVNYYAELDEPAAPGVFRKGAHTDWGSLTILYHDGAAGLQIKSPEGIWEDVPVVPDSMVVNLGDLMARWTNDRWVSTLHRVLAPEPGTGDRMSIAYFHQPAYDAYIECIPTCTSPDDPPHHEPTTSGEWIQSMFNKTLY